GGHDESTTADGRAKVRSDMKVSHRSAPGIWSGRLERVNLVLRSRRRERFSTGLLVLSDGSLGAGLAASGIYGRTRLWLTWRLDDQLHIVIWFRRLGTLLGRGRV